MKKFSCNKKPIAFLLLACLFLLSSTSGCGKSDKNTESTYDETLKVSESANYFDTSITITLYGTQDSSPIQDCFALADQYEKLFSATVEGSDVYRINQAAGSGQAVTVSEETITLLEAGLKYGQLSQGHYDITIGKLTALWNISELSQELEDSSKELDASYLPSPSAIDELLAHVDDACLEIKENQVLLTDSEAAIDLGSLAKGYIADQMKLCLQEDGVQAGIINLGGNILTVGSKPSGDDYCLGIQKPFASIGQVIGSLNVKDASVVTSGTYERYFTVDGKLYHHLLDAQTGYPCQNQLSSVTIVSQSSLEGDGLSTVCFLLGLEDGMDLIESLEDTEAIFVTEDGQVSTSSGLEGAFQVE